MTVASIEVVQASLNELYQGFTGKPPRIFIDIQLYIILGLGVFMKFFLWIDCLVVNKSLHSDTIVALGEDHFNDVVSNSVAIATAASAFQTSAWWIDPLGAIVISLVLIYRWVLIINEQVKKIVGYTASPEFIEMVSI
jgi:divalent metal cation (Fe/Co/Zn/Cd) transporter